MMIFATRMDEPNIKLEPPTQQGTRQCRLFFTCKMTICLFIYTALCDNNCDNLSGLRQWR